MTTLHQTTQPVYNNQDTDFYLNLSNSVTSVKYIRAKQYPYESVVNYLVTCAGYVFDVEVEEPKETSIDDCYVSISYEGKTMFRDNIQKVKEFFDYTSMAILVFA